MKTFFDGGAIISDRTSVVCIGEFTAEALESHGVNSFKIAKTKDTDGILETFIKEVTLKEGYIYEMIQKIKSRRADSQSCS